mgnify:CR=1 FL=1
MVTTDEDKAHFEEQCLLGKCDIASDDYGTVASPRAGRF